MIQKGRKSLAGSNNVLRYNAKEAVLQNHGLLPLLQIEEQSQQRQKTLDITNGPVSNVDVFEVQQEGQVILFSADHLIIRLVSWRVIWNDFEQALGGKQLHRPLSFKKWCQLQHAETKKSTLADVLPFVPQEC